jgi:transposase
MSESSIEGSVATCNRKPHFSKQVIQQVVHAIERGASRGEVIKRYGMAKSTLSDWMREYGSASYHASLKPLSSADRRSLVRAIQEGGMSLVEAKRVFNVKSTLIVKRYLREAEKEKAELGKICMLMDSNEARPEPISSEDAAALKKALEEAELKIKALNTLIDVAEEQFKIDIRKKPGAKQSSE